VTTKRNAASTIGPTFETRTMATPRKCPHHSIRTEVSLGQMAILEPPRVGCNVDAVRGGTIAFFDRRKDIQAAHRHSRKGEAPAEPQQPQKPQPAARLRRSV